MWEYYTVHCFGLQSASFFFQHLTLLAKPSTIFMFVINIEKGPKETDELLVPPGKAYTPLTDHLFTG